MPLFAVQKPRTRFFVHEKPSYPTTKTANSGLARVYYGVRYLDPKTSRWISADPAMGEYVPQAPINDDAKKHNKNLPGMGGVFNYVNFHVYHYAGNNPVKLVDPDGRFIRDQGNGLKVGTRAMENIRWGLYGNIADNGCGVIAAYNVLYSKNPNTNFFRVRDRLGYMGGDLGFGMLGTKPGILEKYMESKFNDVSMDFNVLGIDILKNAEKTGQADAVIVCVMWEKPLEDGGAHYFAGIRKDGTDEFYFYNSSINGVDDNTPITMQQLSEKIKADKANPIGLITVNDKKNDW